MSATYDAATKKMTVNVVRAAWDPVRRKLTVWTSQSRLFGFGFGMRVIGIAPASAPVISVRTSPTNPLIAVISWGVVTNATRYQAQIQVVGSTSWADVPVVGLTATTPIGIEGTAYRFRVRAYIGTVAGAWSLPVEWNAPVLSRDVRNVRFTFINHPSNSANRIVRMVWDAPVAATTGYGYSSTLVFRHAGGGQVVVRSVGTTTTRQLDFPMPRTGQSHAWLNFPQGVLAADFNNWGISVAIRSINTGQEDSEPVIYTAGVSTEGTVESSRVGTLEEFQEGVPDPTGRVTPRSEIQAALESYVDGGRPTLSPEARALAQETLDQYADEDDDSSLGGRITGILSDIVRDSDEAQESEDEGEDDEEEGRPDPTPEPPPCACT